MFLSHAARDDFDIRFTGSLGGQDVGLLKVLTASNSSWGKAISAVAEEAQGGVR